MSVETVPVDEEAQHGGVFDDEAPVGALAAGLGEDGREGGGPDGGFRGVDVGGVGAGFEGEERDFGYGGHGWVGWLRRG